MVSEQVKQALQRIVAIVSGWDAAGGANEIERELVLGKLRELYEQVKFMDAPAEVSTAPDAPAAAPQPEAPAETGNVQAEPAADTPPAPSTDFEAPVVEQAMADEASLFDMGEMACQASRNSTLDRRLILSLYGEAPDDEPGLPKDPGEETVVEKVVVAEIEPIEEDDAPEEEPTQEPEIETEPEP
jgi:hypothetical protein